MLDADLLRRVEHRRPRARHRRHRGGRNQQVADIAARLAEQDGDRARGDDGTATADADQQVAAGLQREVARGLDRGQGRFGLNASEEGELESHLRAEPVDETVPRAARVGDDEDPRALRAARLADEAGHSLAARVEAYWRATVLKRDGEPSAGSCRSYI